MSLRLINNLTVNCSDKDKDSYSETGSYDTDHEQ